MKNQIKQGLKLARNVFYSYFGEHAQSKPEARLWILMYHRILPKDDPRYAAEEPGMLITPETLALHFSEVQKLFTPVHLSQWLADKEAGKPLPEKACAITFDDGWFDNYQYAWPVIQRFQMPASIFIVADMMGTEREFWPNLLAKLQQELSPEQLSQQLYWLPNIEAIVARTLPKAEELAQLIDSAKALNDAELYQKLEPLVAQLPKQQAALMNWQQVAELNQSPLIEFGSHTCNHYRLNQKLGADSCRHEIQTSKQVIDKALNQDTRLFCYPNGDYSDLSAELVKQTYQAAVTTTKGINTAGSELHKLVRIGVHEDISRHKHDFRARLSGKV